MSPKYKLNKQDGKKLLKGLSIALAGTALAYASSHLKGIDFGTWTPLLYPLFSVLIHAGIKFLEGEDK